MGRGVAVTPAALLPALLGAKVHHLLHHTGQPFYTVGAHIWLLSLTDRNTGHFHPVPTKTAILPEEHLLQLSSDQYEPDKLLWTLLSSAQVLSLFLFFFSSGCCAQNNAGSCRDAVTRAPSVLSRGSTRCHTIVHCATLDAPDHALRTTSPPTIFFRFSTHCNTQSAAPRYNRSTAFHLQKMQRRSTLQRA